ncbi:MAG: penicillin-binding protein [Capnocytophaga sp.]|nr:penicillin-binding protein [Capnocytophaga sp.]
MPAKDRKILIRTRVVAGLMLLFAMAVVVKLFNIQIEGEAYREKADETTLREASIVPSMGNLYSDDGSLLATSVTRYDVRWDALTPSDKNFEKYVKPLSDSLSAMFKKSSSYYQNMLRKERSYKNRYLLIGRNLGYSDYTRLRKFPLLNMSPYKGGVIIETKTTREYPLGSIAHRSIGYERKDENGYITRVGLEGAFSKYLRGVEGRRLEQKIAKGQWKMVSGFNIIDPKDGHDVVSTININIQDIAHHALLTQLEQYKADHGCVVVMEVSTGEVKAISNLGRSKEGKYYERLNYAIGEAHEPGSVFKLMTLVTAMEERGIDTSYVVDTKQGKLTFYGKNVHDSNKKGYGKISIAKAFAVSSNTGFVQMTHDLFSKKPKQFTDRLETMGLAQPLGLPILGEGKPYIPNPKDKKNWSGISLEWMSFGYGLHLTPMQTLTFYNAIANNGVMVKPRLIKEVKEWNKTIEKFNVEVINHKICSEQTAQKAKVLLQNAVEKPYGTARKLYSPDFSMAGKTGTAQKDYKDKSKLGYISSFTGFFPADNPKYSCIVVIHNPDKNIGYYGNDVSGPVFKAIAQKIYTNSLLIDTIEEVDDASERTQNSYDDYYAKAQKYKTIMPNVVGMNAMDAVALLENMGMKVKLVGGGRVSTQSVASGTKLKKQETIILQLS